jgi:hypothetical protein
LAGGRCRKLETGTQRRTTSLTIGIAGEGPIKMELARSLESLHGFAQWGGILRVGQPLKEPLHGEGLQ